MQQLQQQQALDSTHNSSVLTAGWLALAVAAVGIHGLSVVVVGVPSLHQGRLACRLGAVAVSKLWCAQKDAPFEVNLPASITEGLVAAAARAVEIYVSSSTRQLPCREVIVAAAGAEAGAGLWSMAGLVKVQLNSNRLN